MFSNKISFRSILPRDILRKIIGMKGEPISDECMKNLSKERLIEVKIMHFFLNIYLLQAMLRKFIIPDIIIDLI